MTGTDSQYEKWKADKKTITVPDGFTDGVMARIHQDIALRNRASLRRRLLPTRLMRHWLVRTGLVAASVALGFLRWTIMARLLFG